MYASLRLLWIRGTKRTSIKPPPRPYVAKLHMNERGTLERVFLSGTCDYSEASYSGHRLTLYFAIPPGVYEVRETLSWRKSRRYYLLVNEVGAMREISFEEVMSWLKNAG